MAHSIWHTRIGITKQLNTECDKQWSYQHCS